MASASLMDSRFTRKWKVTHNKIYVEDEQYICGDGRDVEWLAVNSGRMWPGLVGDNWIKTRMASCCQYQLDRIAGGRLLAHGAGPRRDRHRSRIGMDGTTGKDGK